MRCEENEVLSSKTGTNTLAYFSPFLDEWIELRGDFFFGGSPISSTLTTTSTTLIPPRRTFEWNFLGDVFYHPKFKSSSDFKCFNNCAIAGGQNQLNYGTRWEAVVAQR
jgi:hypothetical protein